MLFRSMLGDEMHIRVVMRGAGCNWNNQSAILRQARASQNQSSFFGLLFLIVKSDGEKNRDTVTLSSNTLLLCLKVSAAFVVQCIFCSCSEFTTTQICVL